MMTVAKKSSKTVSKPAVKKTKVSTAISKEKPGLKKKLLKALCESGKYSKEMILKLTKELEKDEFTEKPKTKERADIVEPTTSNAKKRKAKTEEDADDMKPSTSNIQRKRKRKLEDETQSDELATENAKKRKSLKSDEGKGKEKVNGLKKNEKLKSAMKKKGGVKEEEESATNEEALSKRKLKIKNIVEKKMKPENLSKKDRRALRVVRRKDGNLVQSLLAHWEELRAGSCPQERRVELCSSILAASVGKIAQLVLAHDTSRVFEAVLKLGSDEQRLRVLEELQGEETMRGLMRSKFGKHVLHKMLLHGTGRHKERVFAAMEGNVQKLFHHRQGIFILNTAFNDHATAPQRESILQELYGPPFSLFKQAGVSHLAEAFANNPKTDKKPVLEHVKMVLLKAIVKGNVNHLLFHTLVYDFFQNCSDESQRSELVQALREHIVALLHTREGVKAAMTVLWYSNNKDRKAILRSMKTFFPNTAMDEHGYLFVLAILDAVDDIVLLSKLVLKELFESFETLLSNQHGRRVLLYMLSRRKSCHFPPQLIEILSKGDSNQYTKKSSEVRTKELRERILPPLTNYLANNLKLVLSPNNALLLLRELLVVGSTEENPVGGFDDVVAELSRLILNDEHVCADGNESIIENSGSHIALKRALHESKEGGGDLGGQLLKHFEGQSLEKLLVTNRGCFLLVALCETCEGAAKKLKPVVHHQLGKQNSTGANILKKKLST